MMMKNFTSLARNSRGSITVELALAAPLLATLLIGLIDISTLYSDKLRLEQVAQRMVEKVQQTGFKTSDETSLESEAATAAGTGAVADVTYWLECNGVKQTGAYTDTCSGNQTLARYMQIDITKSHSPIILANFAGSATNGSYTLHGKAGLRTL